MSRIKKILTAAVLMMIAVCFVQAVGSHLVAQLRTLDEVGLQAEQHIEEKVVKQMVLQLEPQEYYTVQIGSYPDVISGQQRVNALAQAGYRVFVSEEAPYRLWIGCTGAEPSLEHLPEEITSVGSDVFVQKLILNQSVFQFPAEDASELQEVAVLLSSYDVMFKHSLKLFQDYCYENCSEENWTAMIGQVQEELKLLQTSAQNFLMATEQEAIVSKLLDLLTVTEEYSESLQLIADKKNTQVVLLSQSCLLELIAQYHSFMEQASIVVQES